MPESLHKPIKLINNAKNINMEQYRIISLLNCLKH